MNMEGVDLEVEESWGIGEAVERGLLVSLLGEASRFTVDMKKSWSGRRMSDDKGLNRGARIPVSVFLYNEDSLDSQGIFPDHEPDLCWEFRKEGKRAELFDVLKLRGLGGIRHVDADLAKRADCQRSEHCGSALNKRTRRYLL